MHFYSGERSANSTLSGVGLIAAPQFPLQWRILPLKTRGTIQALKSSLKENSPRVFLKEKLLELLECLVFLNYVTAVQIQTRAVLTSCVCRRFE